MDKLHNFPTSSWALLYLVLPVLISSVCGCSEPKRIEATLPAVEVVGVESGSFSLYSKSSRGGATALGQVFLPPKGHPVLKRVDFLCRYASSYSSASDFNVKLTLSPWAGDRPAYNTLWESEVVSVPKDIDGWVSFDVPHVMLNPDQRYIAWLSMSGLGNADDAIFGVVSMGPRTTTPRRPDEPWQPNNWTSAYPEGARAFWRENHPYNMTDVMAESPWITDGPGQNLHFRMVFENRKPKE